MTAPADLTYLYVGDVLKYDDTPDGLVVEGVATSNTLDADRERCDPRWLKSAMPKWMEWGNVREQHSSIAAGVGLDLEEADPDKGKWTLRSLVVDPVTQTKVKNHVLKGYSIGIRGTQRTKTNGQVWINGGDIVEISLVDRPANPDCFVSVAKSANGGGDLLSVPAGDVVWQAEANKAITLGSAFTALIMADTSKVLNGLAPQSSDALGNSVDCPLCGGHGTLDWPENKQVCERCHGSGQIGSNPTDPVDDGSVPPPHPTNPTRNTDADTGGKGGHEGPTKVDEPDDTKKLDRVACPTCKGHGKVRGGHIVCPTCKGNKVVTQAQADAANDKAPFPDEDLTVEMVDTNDGKAVLLTHTPTGIKAQGVNRDAAEKVLEVALAERGDGDPDDTDKGISTLDPEAPANPDNGLDDDATQAFEEAINLATAQGIAQAIVAPVTIEIPKSNWTHQSKGAGVEEWVVPVEAVKALLAQIPDDVIAATRAETTAGLEAAAAKDEADPDSVAALQESVEAGTTGRVEQLIAARAKFETAWASAVEAEDGKKQFTDKERADLADSGQAMPGGGYPIRNVQDLKDAISAIGRAKDPAATRAHIIKRAKALGHSELIPKGWVDGDGKAVTPDDDAWTHDPGLLAQVRTSLCKLMQAELDEMINGEFEVNDIQQLLASLQMFLCWWQNEAWNGEDPSPYQVTPDTEDAVVWTQLGIDPDVIEKASASDATDEDKAALAKACRKAVRKMAKVKAAKKAAKPDPEAEKAAVGDAVKAAMADDEFKSVLAEAVTPTVKEAMDEATKGFVERLETVEQMAAPGGPVRARSEETRTKATRREELLEAARKHLELANGATDMTLKQGHRDLARQAQAEADALVSA